LIPVMHIDGLFVSQIIQWAIDAVISVVLFFLFYRSDEHLSKIITSVQKKLEKK